MLTTGQKQTFLCLNLDCTFLYARRAPFDRAFTKYSIHTWRGAAGDTYIGVWQTQQKIARLSPDTSLSLPVMKLYTTSAYNCNARLLGGLDKEGFRTVTYHNRRRKPMPKMFIPSGCMRKATSAVPKEPAVSKKPAVSKRRGVKKRPAVPKKSASPKTTVRQKPGDENQGTTSTKHREFCI
jgi:hypothetical protein